MAGGGIELVFEVRVAVFIAYDPGIEVRDGTLPGTQGNTPVRQVVVFLNGSVQGSHWESEPSRGESGEIVAEEVRGEKWDAGEEGGDNETAEAHDAIVTRRMPREIGAWRPKGPRYRVFATKLREQRIKKT